MAKKKSAPEQPNEEAQQTLSDIIGNETDYIEVRGKVWAFKWLRNGTKRKITELMLSRDDGKQSEDMIATKCVAAMRLNDYWKLKFFYWFLWRKMYYFNQFTYEELLPVVSLVKKKAPATAYFLVITSLTEMKDTMMTMTRAEVERTRQELLMAQLGRLPKNTNASQKASPSSEESAQSLSGDTTGDTQAHK